MCCRNKDKKNQVKSNSSWGFAVEDFFFRLGNLFFLLVALIFKMQAVHYITYTVCLTIIKMPLVKNNCFAISTEESVYPYVALGVVHLFKVITKVLIVREGDKLKIDGEIKHSIISIRENA